MAVPSRGIFGLGRYGRPIEKRRRVWRKRKANAGFCIPPLPA
jgi:hypothetical protein